MDNMWEPIKDNGHGFKRGEICLLSIGDRCGKSKIGQVPQDFSKYEMDNGFKDTYQKTLEAVTKERVNILDECLFSYLAIVQKWDVEKVKLYLKNAKNVKVKGAEFLKRVNMLQGHDLEYWYFKDDLIMVTNKITLEIYQVGDWINGK